MEEDSKERRRDGDDKNRKRAAERSRVDAGVMPWAVKYKGTEGRTTGHSRGSGWEYMRERETWERQRERGRACMFANQREFLYLPDCLWTLHLLGVCVAGKRVLTLFTRRGDGCLPSVAVLLLSSGHVYESQIIRSELRWTRACRNWLHSLWVMSAGTSVMWPTAPTPSDLAEPQKRRKGKIHQFARSNLQFWHVLACSRDTRRRWEEYSRERK